MTAQTFTKKCMRYGLFVLECVLLIGCAASAPRIYIPQQEPSAHYLKRQHPEVILVLGSGSSRGFAHAGVLKVLEENHIPIDMIVGTSAGSIIGALYADHPSAKSLQHLLITTNRNEVMDFSLMNLRTGVISGNQLQQFLVQHMHAQTFEQLRIPFIAVASDLDSGKMHAFGSGPIAPAVNASSAVPALFRPVQLYGRTYIDGGMIDPVAVDVAEWFHPKIIIAVNLNAPLSPSMPTSTPGVFLRGVDMMMEKLNDYSSSQADVVIRPKLQDIDMFDGSNRKDVIQSGIDAANAALPEIKRLLAEQHIRLAY